MIQTIAWTGKAARLLDQTRLPTETVYVDITDETQMWDAIKRLVIRGAPAIGVAAAFGVYLGIRHVKKWDDFYARVNDVCDYLATSRPTAVNLFWALDRIKRIATVHPKYRAMPVKLLAILKQRVLDECIAMIAEDNKVCRSVGMHGMGLFRRPKNGGPINVLTHCNAGGLATVQFGTALAPIYIGTQRGLKFHVYADETRPLLQGSRITAYELQANGIPVTVICDNMAATVMSQGKISAVIVGTDRVAANGDVANKIGTHGVAILARHFGIPFYVAAPLSSIDFNIASGAQIPIEQRDAREVTDGMGRQTAPPDVAVFNPAFDVTPAELVTAIITEKGVVRRPNGKKLSAMRRH